MNNQGKKIFFLRRGEDTRRSGGEKAYEEDFYINQQHSFFSRNSLHFYAYGDCLWRSRFRQDLKDSRTWWAFEFVREGNGILTCDNISYDLHPGDLYILRPDKTIFAHPGSNGFLRKKTILLEGCLNDYICKDLQSVNVIRPESPLRLEKIYADVKQLILAQGEFVQEELEVQAYALLVELNRLAMPMQYPLSLCQALKLINANLHLKHTLNSLSLECKVSTSTLSKLFQRYLNISPINYIIDRRLEYAKQLIKVSNMQLKEIAERCGYNSESFLSRSFKKKFGMPPALCRRS
jgi:AraC-like DNA-binding protein